MDRSDGASDANPPPRTPRLVLFGSMVAQSVQLEAGVAVYASKYHSQTLPARSYCEYLLMPAGLDPTTLGGGAVRPKTASVASGTVFPQG